MNYLEIIEKLCMIARMQADIIDLQTKIIAQAEITVEDLTELNKMRSTAEKELKEIDRDIT